MSRAAAIGERDGAGQGLNGLEALAAVAAGEADRHLPARCHPFRVLRDGTERGNGVERWANALYLRTFSLITGEWLREHLKARLALASLFQLQ